MDNATSGIVFGLWVLHVANLLVDAHLVPASAKGKKSLAI